MIKSLRKSLEWIPGKKHAKLWIKFGIYMKVCKRYPIAIFVYLFLPVIKQEF